MAQRRTFPQLISQKVVKKSGSTSQVSVLGAATLILAANPNRVDLAIYNNTVATVWIGFENTVTALTGFPIDINNGGIAIDTYWGPVYGITGGAAITVGVIEI